MVGLWDELSEVVDAGTITTFKISLDGCMDCNSFEGYVMGLDGASCLARTLSFKACFCGV